MYAITSSSINQKSVKGTIKDIETNTKNTIVASKKTDNKNSSVSFGAGIGITALAVGGILYHKKINSKASMKLDKHIEYKEAKTLDEAIKFGIDNLGIQKYKGFEESDLDVVNWINEGLVNINNLSNGKAIMPKKIIYKTLDNNSMGTVGGTMNIKGTLTISKKYIENIKEVIKKYAIMSSSTTKITQEFFNKMNNNKNFKSWQNEWINILKKHPNIAQNKVPTYTSTFSVINHEMGHLQHYHNTNTNFIILENKFSELFKNSQNIASKVSEYATISPTEFVAECYAKMVDGVKLDSDVIDLYQKLDGVLI